MMNANPITLKRQYFVTIVNQTSFVLFVSGELLHQNLYWDSSFWQLIQRETMSQPLFCCHLNLTFSVGNLKNCCWELGWWPVDEALLAALPTGWMAPSRSLSGRFLKLIADGRLMLCWVLISCDGVNWLSELQCDAIFRWTVSRFVTWKEISHFPFHISPWTQQSSVAALHHQLSLGLFFLKQNALLGKLNRVNNTWPCLFILFPLCMLKLQRRFNAFVPPLTRTLESSPSTF